MRRKSKYTKELLEPLVKNNMSFRGVIRDLGLSVVAGGNSAYITKLIRGYGIDTSHMKGQAHGTTVPKSEPRPLEEVMVENSTYNRGSLKSRLLKQGVLENKCELCDLKEWQGKPIVMRLDHINGVNNDHRRENLRMVCPNCDSQLPTFCGRKLRKKERKQYNCYVSPNINTCVDCNTNISRKATRCKSCTSKGEDKRKVKNRPSKEQLLREIEETSYCAVGRKYGVSGNAVRKWVK